jgi:hypothetical protein
MREVPIVVFIWMSMVPTSVTVPRCIPSRTSSPIKNRIVLSSKPSDAYYPERYLLSRSFMAIAVRNPVEEL